ncbi:MAG TPA: carbon-nitrogen family hydrolase [Pirellulales bacterium]|nr:carbon-nitrogen family hydrolase [Pirellulales bacterium]
MQVIGCQFDIEWEKKPANYDRVESLLAAARVDPGSLVVLPEMFATGFSMHVDTIAEAPDGATHSFLAGLAKKLSSVVMAGVVLRAADGRGRNEALIYGPEGNRLASYAKLHPFSYGGESKYYAAGDEVTIFEWHDLSVAPFICYDLRFPEAFRRAVRSGAQLLVVIANWPLARQPHWLALLRARAIENQAYVVGVNRVGSDPHAQYGGHSLIVGPRGETVAEGTDESQLVTADLELAPLVEYRQQFPALADMRADLFAE